MWSFRVYYEKCFATEPDPTLRFANALIASCRPIRDRWLVYEWNRQRQERNHCCAGTVRKRKRKQHADAEALST